MREIRLANLANFAVRGYQFAQRKGNSRKKRGEDPPTCSPAPPSLNPYKLYQCLQGMGGVRVRRSTWRSRLIIESCNCERVCKSQVTIAYNCCLSYVVK